jgi:hypothetical protein
MVAMKHVTNRWRLRRPVLGAAAALLTTLGASCAVKDQQKQAPKTATPTTNGTVALLTLVDTSGTLSVGAVRQLPNELFRPTTVGPTATHEWSLHSDSGQTLVSGTFQIRTTAEVPPGGPDGGPQEALNEQVAVVSFGLHVPWPSHGQYIEIDGLDAAGHPLPHSKLVWP